MRTFSIVIPTLNAGATLGAALESIAGQTYSKYEILLRDGGSTDQTVAVAESFRERFGGRLNVVSQRDDGIYPAMNAAISGAAGRWIYFLGADDSLHDSQVLQKVAEAICAFPTCQMIYGDVLLASQNNRYAGAFDLQRICQINICHQAVFYRREIFHEIGLFDPAYPTWADWDLNARCFLAGTVEIRYHDLVVAHYNDLDGYSSGHTDPELIAKLQSASPRPKRRKGMFTRLRRFLENKIDGL